MSDLEVIIWFGLALASLLAILLLARGKAEPDAVDAPVEVPENAILVDGSNVMHWGGEPSILVLTRVLRALEDKGLTPFVCFDANFGYKLWGRYVGAHIAASELSLPPDQVYVVDKGVVADEVLLDLAATHGLQVVSNDRFRDWAEQYHWVKDHRRFRRGRWQEGSVIWQ